MKRNHEMNQGVLLDAPFPAFGCVHTQIEQQAQRTPEQTALVFEDARLSYRALNERANRLAARLIENGVTVDCRVGVRLDRSIDRVIAALAVLKAGGVHVPLDPALAAEHIRLVIQETRPAVILTRKELEAEPGLTDARVVFVDSLSSTDAVLPDRGARTAPTAANMACIFYPPGSDGKPGAVMMDHGQLMKYFTALDERLDHEHPGTWLAATNFSSEFSVVELFWTLARGFKVVLQGDMEEPVAAGAKRRAVSLGFSLFLWGNDDAPGRDKYRLMLEGAKYFDRHGFEAVWTPERHFHAFGGPYPNPSVAAAALATVTERIGIRAGSCVSPLHHPIRIAEEWAVVDNLSNGRVALAFASGWQLNDFVLRPENHADNKRVTMEQIDQVRRLWRGEKILFRNPRGEDVAIQTLPRPVQPELPVWVTSAGNPDTYRQAGALGANVLTHLLGQSLDEVAKKIALYRQARAAAGHDPATGRVTLMLHTFVGDDDARVRELVRRPLKDYLRSSLKLVLELAGAFPAFKQSGRAPEKSREEDLRDLPESEMEAMLDVAFERYFETSGLFGTPSTCARMVERCRNAGVNEIACLLDFGVPTDQVLTSLPLLNEVREQSNPGTQDSRNRRPHPQRCSLAEQIERHGVTHLQCTPSLARQFLSDPPTRAALSRIRHLLVAGESLPEPLARELKSAVGGEVRNIPGPANTNGQSTPRAMNSNGHPAANTQTHGFLAKLRDRDVQVWAEGDRLRCNAPAGALTPDLRDELRRRKHDILEFLRSAGTLARQQRAIVPLQSSGNLPPVFGVAGHNGDVFCYRAVARHLGEDQPFFGLQPPGLDGHGEPLSRVEDLAAYFAAQIRAFRPNGPCVIAGFCSGGGIAFELARQLVRDGMEVRFLALFGCPYPTWYRFLPQLRFRLKYEADRVARHVRALASLSFAELRSYITTRLRNLRAERAARRSAPPDPVLVQRENLGHATLAAVRQYKPDEFHGRVCLFLPARNWLFSNDAPSRWESVAPGTEVWFGPDGCNTDVMLRDPYAPVFARYFRKCNASSAEMESQGSTNSRQDFPREAA